MMLRVAPRFIFRLRLGFEFPGRPGSSLLWLRLMDSRVSSVLAPSGFAAPASPGFPESYICGWVDDDSRSSSNFASSARLRMNLRIQSGFAHLRPTLDAFSKYHSGSTCRQDELCTSDFNCILHRLSSRNCVSRTVHPRRDPHHRPPDRCPRLRLGHSRCACRGSLKAASFRT